MEEQLLQLMPFSFLSLFLSLSLSLFLFYGKMSLFLFLEANICQISAFSGNEELFSFSMVCAGDEMGWVREFHFCFYAQR